MLASDKVLTRPEEIFFDEDQLIVSKTDVTGRITYANQTFSEVSGYTAREYLGQQHSIVRHPDMPRCVFQLLWDTIQSGREIFAFVKNLAKDGRYYWVYAHVSPSFDESGAISGYHSTRRVPNRVALLSTIIPLYARLLQEEQRHSNRKIGQAAGVALLTKTLDAHATDYDRFVHACAVASAH